MLQTIIKNKITDFAKKLSLNLVPKQEIPILYRNACLLIISYEFANKDVEKLYKTKLQNPFFNSIFYVSPCALPINKIVILLCL